MNDLNKQVKTVLEKHGLETHVGCRVPLLRSVKQEYGQEVLDDVIRQFSDAEVMRAVQYALVVNGLID
jgi:hypothetical protein